MASLIDEAKITDEKKTNMGIALRVIVERLKENAKNEYPYNCKDYKPIYFRCECGCIHLKFNRDLPIAWCSTCHKFINIEKYRG